VSVASRPGPTTRRTVHEVSGGARSVRVDTVVTEEPLEIRLQWGDRPATRVAVTMRTPGNDFELAAGFLLTESVIKASQVEMISYCVDPTLTKDQQYNVVTVEIAGPPLQDPAARFTAVSAACGVCGKDSLDSLLVDRPPLQAGGKPVDWSVIASLPDRLRSNQALFGRTGGLHAAGVFTADGELVVLREDVGRHNAVDKVVGARVLDVASYGDQTVLCVSGRAGFDIMTKAVVARFGVVVAVGAPSSLAVETAEAAGLALVGFARGQRFVTYTHPERITGAT
jgi:FdhD protein